MSSIEEQASAITKKVQAHFDRIKAEAYQRGYEDAKKEKNMAQKNETPDLPTALEECAEHLRAGRDPRDYFECNGFDFEDAMGCLQHASARDQIRRKRPTITINGVEVPAPETVEPRKGERYYRPCDALSTDMDSSFLWQGDSTDIRSLRAGQVYINKSDRDQAAQAIIKALRGEQ